MEKGRRVPIGFVPVWEARWESWNQLCCTEIQSRKYC